MGGAEDTVRAVGGVGSVVEQRIRVPDEIFVDVVNYPKIHFNQSFWYKHTI